VRCLRAVVCVVVLAMAVPGCSGKRRSQSVLDVSASGNLEHSPVFKPPGQWTLQWRWDCSGQRATGNADADGFAVVVFNADDDSITSEGTAPTAAGATGEGTAPFSAGGAFYLRVSSPCDWRVQALKPGR
jgi:hypothetical protein